jgi:dTDP-4-amino-4,6-dideoxygalactose transaminase
MLEGCDLITPAVMKESTHVFHQYTIRFENSKTRDKVKAHLASQGIPSMIYYPLPLHHQEAYREEKFDATLLKDSEMLCEQVLSLPMHTELTTGQQEVIVKSLKEAL